MHIKHISGRASKSHGEIDDAVGSWVAAFLGRCVSGSLRFRVAAFLGRWRFDSHGRLIE